MSRIGILKTYKLFIGGKFPRTESGRSLPAYDSKGALLANYCHASRKDLRDAVVAARKAQPGWAKSTACLRGQILYRAAEMLEQRADSMIAEMQTSGIKAVAAQSEVNAAIEHLVHYAGWTDKFQQLFSAVNPVASSHFNFTTPEPTGIVGILCPDTAPLSAFVALMASAIASGNSAILFASETHPLPAISFAEVLATSDLPGGVVNILTGQRKELAPQFASHMDINALVDAAHSADLQVACAGNLKRYVPRDVPPNAWTGDAARSPYWIHDTVELKTAWHPIGA